jgi:hypothetical protein
MVIHTLRTSTSNKLFYLEEHRKRLKISKNIYEVQVDGEQTIKLDLVFNPKEVAAYDFELPITINKPRNKMAFMSEESKTNTTNTDAKFYELINGISRDKTPSTPKSQKQLVDYTPNRHVTAIGLRYALSLSTTRVHFEIPLLYLERLQHGGFFEAKVLFKTKIKNRLLKYDF